MEAPLISIIIPVYQAERYLRRGLDSVLHQTDGRWEALCINDGSTDHSADILEEYARRDPRFRLFHQENSGVSAARNLGIREARGTHITFLDADDWLADDLVATLLPLTGEDIDIVLFSARFEYEGDSTLPRSGGHGHLIRREGVFTMQPALLSEAVGACCGKLYRRDFLLRHELLFPLHIRQEDEVFYRCSMAVARRIRLLPYVGYHYLQAEGSYMHSGLSPQESYRRYLKGMSVVYDYYRRHNCLPAWEETVLDFLADQMWCCELCTPADAMRPIRQETLEILRETEIPTRFARDTRYRYIAHHPGREALFFRRGGSDIIFRFFGITLFYISRTNKNGKLVIPLLEKLKRSCRR